MKLFEVRESTLLPSLGWVATVADETVSVEVGSGVECGPDWVVEGVWSGDFSSGGFHRSEAFWGSGLRLDGGALYVVPSIAITDRIVYARAGSRVHISNSLPLLLGRLGICLDSKMDYGQVSYALKAGVDRYESLIPVSDSSIEVRALYHSTLVIDAGRIEIVRRHEPRSFSSFSDYFGAMTAVVGRVTDNIRDPARKSRMSVIATASSGYDSACVSVFARLAGAVECVTASASNSLLSRVLGRGDDDSGEPVARALGLKPIILSAVPSSNEIHYRSASCIRPELAFDGIASHLKGQIGVVFTGFYGDTAWGIVSPGNTDSELQWPEPSGISVCEGRIHSGYINLALPFLYGRSRAALLRISVSEEMLPWRLGNDYDRPIPRRILEDAGVPRELFGRAKRAILNLEDRPINAEARRSFYAWLARQGPIGPLHFRARQRLNELVFVITALWHKARELAGGSPQFTKRDPMWARVVNPPNLMFQWAVSTVASKYARSIDR